MTEKKCSSESSSQVCCRGSHVGCLAFQPAQRGSCLETTTDTPCLQVYHLAVCSWGRFGLDVCFVSWSCSRINLWTTRHTPGYCLALQNAVEAVLVLGASDPGCSRTAPDHHPSSSMFDSLTLWKHPLASSKMLCDKLKVWNFDSSVHHTFHQSFRSPLACFVAQLSLFVFFWHLSNGLLAATRPV